MDFQNAKSTQTRTRKKLPKIAVQGGVAEQASLAYEADFSYLDVTGADLSKIIKELKLPKQAKAPVKKGQVAGKLVYKLNNQEIGSVNILFQESVKKAKFKDYFFKALDSFFVTD